MNSITVIDAQGGGVGRQLVLAIRARFPDADVTAVGTNAAATSAMMKAGASRAATGENAVVVCSRRADVIVGAIGIVIADAMLGEITPRMAAAEELTPTELQILHLICADKSNAEIAQIMNITLPTVKTHVSHVLEKLDVKRRSEAKTAAKKLWLISNH